MNRTEYKVVPAPQKGRKARGVRSGADRYALAVETLINEMAADGWSYLRAETLPAQERKGLTSTTTVWHNLMVFSRTVTAPVASDLAELRAEAAAPPRAAPTLGPATRVEPSARAPEASPVLNIDAETSSPGTGHDGSDVAPDEETDAAPDRSARGPT